MTVDDPTKVRRHIEGEMVECEAVNAKAWIVGRCQDGHAVISLEMPDGTLVYQCLDMDAAHKITAAIFSALSHVHGDRSLN